MENSLPPIIYKEEGKIIMERLWKETLDELSFAGVKEIIDEIAKGQS